METEIRIMMGDRCYLNWSEGIVQSADCIPKHDLYMPQGSQLTTVCKIYTSESHLDHFDF